MQHPQLRDGAQLVVLHGAASAAFGLDHAWVGRLAAHPLICRLVGCRSEAAGHAP
jgi:hypothetical protein